MLSLLLAAALAAPLPAVQEERPEPPDPKVVQEAKEDLERAFDSGETKEKVDAIQRRGQVADAGVVAWLAKGIKDDDPQVQIAAIGGLRWQEHPDALDVLHATYKRDKKLRKEEELCEALLKAIAQHGEVESIDLLSETSVKGATQSTARARILGLGMIRSEESVEALFKMMKSFGRHKVQPRMDDFRTSLVVLIGDDHGGKSQDAWLHWWNKNKKKLSVSPKPPELPRRMQQAWNRYWDLEVEYERPKRRRERGGGD